MPGDLVNHVTWPPLLPSSLSNKKRKESPPAPCPNKKHKNNWVNWSLEPHLSKLQQAVLEWDKKLGQYFDSNGEAHSLQTFVNVNGIPYDTFKKYVGENQCIIGKGVGCPSLLSSEEHTLIAQTLI